MLKNSETMLAIAGLALSLAACNSQSSTAPDEQAMNADKVPTAPSNDPDAQSSLVMAAAEPFENLTEQAPSAAKEKLAALVAAAEKAAAGVAPGLDAAAKAQLDNHLSEIDTAIKTSDRTEIALAAVEGYRTLVEHAGSTGKIPRNVSLLDYAGFRYQADLAATPVRWDDMGKAVGFAQDQWALIADQVTDTALKEEFAASIAAMDKAVQSKDAKTAKSASTNELDLVDKLEGFFAKA